MSEAPLLFELARVLGLRGLDIGAGRCVWSLKIEDVHRNPYGVVHGGILFTLVDYAMGGALTSVLESGQRCTTLEIKINYVAPATEGEVRAEAWVVSRGARIAVMEAKVTTANVLLAVATGTFYIQGAPSG